MTQAFEKIQMQIMWNRLISVVEEQAQTLLRTAFSPIVRECGDLSAGVFDLQGRMIAQAVTGTPGHVNSMAEAEAIAAEASARTKDAKIGKSSAPPTEEPVSHEPNKDEVAPTDPSKDIPPPAM